MVLSAVEMKQIIPSVDIEDGEDTTVIRNIFVCAYVLPIHCLSHSQVWSGQVTPAKSEQSLDFHAAATSISDCHN